LKKLLECFLFLVVLSDTRRVDIESKVDDKVVSNLGQLFDSPHVIQMSKVRYRVDGLLRGLEIHTDQVVCGRFDMAVRYLLLPVHEVLDDIG
jgi:hypothetical protein